MALTRTIGKNTLGDNNKMRVRLREYDMSSQNLSFVFRSTMGVGNARTIHENRMPERRYL